MVVSNKFVNIELEKSKPHIIVEILEYVPISPFDMLIQIIDGAAHVETSDEKYKLRLDAETIIPAHSAHCFNAKEEFKMISTIIKSGYEELSLWIGNSLGLL